MVLWPITPNQVTNDDSSVYPVLIFEFSYIALINFIINKFVGDNVNKGDNLSQ